VVEIAVALQKFPIRHCY